MHGAGANQTEDIRRLVNLFQVSSIMGRPIERVNYHRVLEAVYPLLLVRVEDVGLDDGALKRLVAACTESYPFPTDLDLNPPINGMAPLSQTELVHECLERSTSFPEFQSRLQALL